MGEIIIAKKDPHSPDKTKDCPDFLPLNDGTIVGDRKYCDRSGECRQIDGFNNPMGYLSEWHDYYEFYTDADGNLQKEFIHGYLCTGNYPIWEERSEDSKAS